MCWQTVSSLTHPQSLQQVSPPPLALTELVSTEWFFSRWSSGFFSLCFNHTVSEILPPGCLNMTMGLVPLPARATRDVFSCHSRRIWVSTDPATWVERPESSPWTEQRKTWIPGLQLGVHMHTSNYKLLSSRTEAHTMSLVWCYLDPICSCPCLQCSILGEPNSCWCCQRSTACSEARSFPSSLTPGLHCI